MQKSTHINPFYFTIYYFTIGLNYGAPLYSSKHHDKKGTSTVGLGDKSILSINSNV